MQKSTTKPKGATSYKETSFGIISHSKVIKLEIEGIKSGLEYIYNLIKNKKTFSINSDLVCALHEISFGWIFPGWAGKYRTIDVTYSGKDAPAHYKVAELITNLCKDFEERLKYLPDSKSENFIIKVVETLAWFQHQFVLIHPFQDYNGRTARMLSSLILLQLDLPPIELKADTEMDRKNYLKAMQEADLGNYTQLESLINDALSESLENI